MRPPFRTAARPSTVAASCLLLVALAGGCALTSEQQEAADRFARAAEGIGSFSSAELLRMRTATIEMNTTSAKLRGRVDPTGLDGAFDPDDVRIRVTAAEALSSYGELLLSLVTASQEEQLSKVSDDFVGSFNALASSEAAAGRLPALDAAQTEALAELVRGIGGMFVEWQKAKAVKKIVKKTQPAVDQVIGLLITDFSKGQGGLVMGFEGTVSRLNNAAGRVLDEAGDASEARRDMAIDAITIVTEETARIDTVTVRAAEVLEQLRAASRELSAAMAEEVSIAQIRQLGGDIRTLANAARVVAGTQP